MARGDTSRGGILGAMHLRQFPIQGLGHLSALIGDDAAGTAAVVDPRRDIDVYLDEARRLDLRITHVVETHLHNDYVSGARELAEVTGAEQLIGAGAQLAYDFRGVRDGDAVDVGSLRLQVLETPGHTPEHVCYAVSDVARAAEPLLMFTGGSLLVGAVGRTDLLGDSNAVPYARQLFASLHDRILRHQDFVGILPTHGGGSLCSSSISSTPSSTLGYERRHNPLLAIEDAEEFARVLLAHQPSYPRYFSRMRSINQAGPAPVGRLPVPRPLQVARVRELAAADHLVIDLRSPAEHAIAHIPGSVSLPAGTSFGTWLGWVVPPDRPLIFVLDSPADWDDAVRQALRIGYDNVEGYLHGGFAAWHSLGAPIETTDRLTVSELRDVLAADGPLGGGARTGDRSPLVLDVRQRDEYERGHVPGAVHLMAGDVPDRLAELPRDRPILTICAAGYRSSVAASLLRDAGFERVTWVSGGVPAWHAAGYPLEKTSA